jgi:hypothetical protein
MNRKNERYREDQYMSVGVMKDLKLNLMVLHVLSETLG